MITKLKQRPRFEFPVPGKRVFQTTIAVVVLLMVSAVVFSWVQKSIAIEVDGQVLSYGSFKQTVGEALTEKGIKLHQKDVVAPGLDTPLKDGLEIKVVRAIQVMVVVDGERFPLLTQPKTVEEILAEAKVALNPKDKVSVPLKQIPDPHSVIKVVRVTEQEMAETQTIPYQSERREDPTLEKGIRRIVQKGKNGKQQVVLKVTYEDGKEVKKEVIDSKMIEEPRPEIVAYGNITSVSRGGHTLHFEKAVIATATAYTHTGRNTYSGTKPAVGTAAVDPSVIKLGSRLYVEGYGFARALDIGGAIKGNRIDLFFETEKECKKWGRKQVKVYVLR
jgi:uncharacterized protein YabE (DUF348 family)